MPTADARWRVAGHPDRVALAALSFGAATALHAVLIAQAKSLPAWMQLLHPFATFIAKSKLLVLPVYPAAWPQAKQHPIVQRFFQFCRYCMSLDVLQKTRYRYQQTERGAAVLADSAGRAAAHIGLADWFNAMRAPLTDMLTWIRRPWPEVMLRLLATAAGCQLVASCASRWPIRRRHGMAGDHRGCDHGGAGITRRYHRGPAITGRTEPAGCFARPRNRGQVTQIGPPNKNPGRNEK